MAIAAAILAAITWATHRYIWARLVRDAELPAAWTRGLTIAFVVLAVSVPVAFFAMRALPRDLGAPLSWVAYVWMGFLLYLFLLTVLSDAGRGLASLVGALPREPERRLFLARAIAAAVGGA